MKMKIGIMTFWWSDDNYGQLLQCYALQQYLREHGHEPFLIRYDPRNDYIPTSLWRRLIKALHPKLLVRFLFSVIKNRQKKNKKIYELKNHPRNFNSFRNEYICQSEKIYRTYAELKENPPDADCYIVGSDQVWNFQNMKLNRCKKPIHAYFLDFGKKSTKRGSYAASWGQIDISDEYKNEITPLLSKFNYISVREKSGLVLCQVCGVKNAELRCDPTLLLSADHYRRLYSTEKNLNSTKRYILVYRLGNPCDFPIKKIFNWVKERNLDVIYVTANNLYDSYKKEYPTISQWLSLVDNADYVITNSFHCCVFSLIFNKKLAVVPLNSSAEGMNSRIETLFELFGIKPRWIKSDDFSVFNEPTNYKMKERPQFNVQEIFNAKS